MNISLIIPTYRNPTYLDLCLKSATENRKDNKNEIIVVVDGHIEESKTVLEKYPQVQVIELQENKGMAFALNVGVMQSNNELIAIINDDNILCTDWDDRTLEAWEDYHKLLISRNTVMTIDQIEPTGPGMFNFVVRDLGKTVDTFEYDKWLDFEANSADPYITTNDGHIFPFVMQKKHYMAIGGFDASWYHSPQVVDWDFFLRLELLHFQFFRSHHLHFYHFGSVVTRKGKDAQIFRQKEQDAYAEYEWKWGTQIYNKPNENSKLPRNGHFRGFKV